jgi:tricorn protease
VIGTASSRLIDGSQFRLPRTGVFTVKGVNMEKEGVAPDVAVEVTPADWARGFDTQLARAVEVVGADVMAWKKSKAGAKSEAVTARPTGGSTATVPATSPRTPTPAVAPMPSPKAPAAPTAKPALVIPRAAE